MTSHKEYYSDLKNRTWLKSEKISSMGLSLRGLRDFYREGIKTESLKETVAGVNWHAWERWQTGTLA